MTNCLSIKSPLFETSCPATNKDCRRRPFQPRNRTIFLLSFHCHVWSVIKFLSHNTISQSQPTVPAKSSHPISESLSLLQMWLCTIFSDVSYQDGLNRCLKNFPQPIYSPRHLLTGAAVPVSSKTLRTWTEQLEFSRTALTNPGHGGK